MGFHGLLGTGHLYEDSSFFALDDRSEHGMPRVWGLRSEGASAQESPVGLGVGNLGFPHRFGFYALALGILELLHPTVDVGLHSTGSTATEIIEDDFAILPGFSRNGKLGLAHVRGRRGGFPIFGSFEGIARYFHGVDLKGADKETQEGKGAKGRGHVHVVFLE